MTQAVVIPAPGAAPELRQLPGHEGDLELVAAELLPLDLQVAAGALPSVPVHDLRAGQNAVARRSDGALVSVQAGRLGWGLGAPIGAFASLLAEPADAVLVPIGLDPLIAAAGVSSGIAARLALTTAGVAAGERVLVVGAAGAVGSAAATLALHQGAEVIELTRASASQILSGSPAPDIVIDCVGGPLLLDVIRASGPRARHVLVGYVGDGVATLPLPLLLVREHRLMGFNVYRADADEYVTAHRMALADLASGLLTVPESRMRTVPFERVAAAYADGARVLLTPG